MPWLEWLEDVFVEVFVEVFVFELEVVVASDELEESENDQVTSSTPVSRSPSSSKSEGLRSVRSSIQ